MYTPKEKQQQGFTPHRACADPTPPIYWTTPLAITPHNVYNALLMC